MKETIVFQQKMRNVAKEVAAIIGEEGDVLDFSIQSLEVIDDRLQRLRREGQTADSIPATIAGIGVYVGEVIRQTLGRGKWVNDSSIGPWPVLEINKINEVTEIRTNPIGNCRKQLDKDIPVCSMKAFAEEFVAMATMSWEDIETHLANSPVWNVYEETPG